MKKTSTRTSTRIQIALITILSMAPSLAFAASTDVKSLAASVTSVIYYTVPILYGLAIVAFFWGLVKYLAAAGGDEKALADGKQIMIYGIIALVVMTSVWGIVEILGKTFTGNDILNNGGQSLPLT